MAKLPSVLPLPLEKTEEEMVALIEKARDWALMHGAAMRSKANFSEDGYYFAPFVLLPTVFPRKEFLKAQRIQTTMNELIHAVAHNRQFLTNCLKDTIQVDEFTGNLFKIYETIQDEGVTQSSLPAESLPTL